MEESGTEIYRLPEECISMVLSLTTPRDSCRSAVVSAAFQSAAESDTVWDRLLPSDISEILSRAVDPLEFATKRDLYFRLCDPILIDGGKLSFALEKSTGAKCYTISARELSIIWGDTPQYWKWSSYPNSRFAEVATLVNVCWLEIRGKLDTRILSPRTTYAAYLLFKILDDESHGLTVPLQETVVRVGPHVSEHVVCLKPDDTVVPRRRLRSRIFGFGNRWMAPDEQREGEEATQQREVKEAVRSPVLRGDGWMEMELGEFFSGEGDDGEVEVSLMEVKGGNWKSGLIIQGVEVRPKK